MRCFFEISDMTLTFQRFPTLYTRVSGLTVRGVALKSGLALLSKRSSHGARTREVTLHTFSLKNYTRLRAVSLVTSPYHRVAHVIVLSHRRYRAIALSPPTIALSLHTIALSPYRTSTVALSHYRFVLFHPRRMFQVSFFYFFIFFI